jgi:hypothetical protein
VIPTGGYVENGDELTKAVVLSKNNEQFGGEIIVKGKTSEKELLVKELVKQIVITSDSRKP